MSIGRLQTEADLTRWVENLFGERFGLVPMHRISGTLNSSQIGGGEPSDGDVPAADSSAEGRGVKWTAPADTDFATDADLAAHEADTSTHGSADLSQAALKNAAQTFTKKQIIAPDSDTQALDLRVGTGTTAPFRLRNNADSANLAFFSDRGGLSVSPDADAPLLNLTRGTDTAPVNSLIRIRNAAQSVTLFSVDANGKATAIGLDAGSQAITNVADATAATEAATKGQLDTGLATKLAKTTDALGRIWATRGQALAAPTSTGHAGTNYMHHVTIAVAQKCTVTGIRYKVGATSSGNVNVALYNADGTKAATEAAVVAQAAANTRQEVAFNATATLEPGIYTAILRLSSGTSTVFCWAAADFLGPAGESSGGMPATQAAPTGLTSVPVPALTLY